VRWWAMATKRVQLTVTAQRFFDDAQNKREAVRVWSAPFKLPHWIENWDTQNGQAKVWVKVPKIPANSSVDLYIYYGNPSAESESDGEAVFEFFDDFEGSSLDMSKWDIYNSPQISISNSILTISGTHSGTTSPEMIKSKAVFGEDYILEARVNQDFTGGNHGGIGFAEGNGYTYPPSTNVAMYTDESISNDKIDFVTEDGANRNVYPAGTYTGGWTTFVLKRSSSSVYFKFSNYEWTSTQYLPQGSLPIHIGGYQTSMERSFPFTIQVDWVRVRKYAGQEPTVVVGEEEASDIPGWLYRRKITITNPNNYDLEHFQVAIDLNTDNFNFAVANPDGSDVRFAIPTRSKIPYYVETWDDQSEKADVWVKVPYLPPNGRATLYIYYGNSTAESESDGEAVFDYFEDFLGTSAPQDWIVDEGGFDWSVDSLAKTATSQQNLAHYAGATFAPPLIIEVKGHARGAESGNVDVHFGMIDANNYYSVSINAFRNEIRISRVTDGSGTLLASKSYAYSDAWYIVSAIWKSDGTITASAQVFDTHEETATVTAVDTTYSSGYIGISGWNTNNTFDWVRVRKYAEQEPIVTVGEEEASDIPGWLYRRKITITNQNNYDLEHFQVAIDLDGSNFDFIKANADGSDIRIAYASARYSLQYYIEPWDTTTPQAVIWVGIDSETGFFVELNPNNTTDESDPSVMSLPEATNYTLNKFERYAGGG